MYRKLLNNLKLWKESPKRQPLVLQGARQVGKTWLIKEFGKLYFKDVIYIDFDSQRDIHAIFGDNIEPERIIEEIEIRVGSKINPINTLIIFDEIQECNRALVSLKYFSQNASQYYIIAAGSLLGVAMHKDNSFPVGKVGLITLYPLDFEEFILAVGETRYQSVLDKGNFKLFNAITTDLERLFKHYLFVGGMPNAVLEYIENKDFSAVSKQHNKILSSYRNDFSKHISKAAFSKVGIIWDSIPTQLAREHKKFIYKNMQPGARASSFEDAMQWLIRTGLVYRIHNVSKIEFPLKTYELSTFKLFMIDVGLLGAAVGVTAQNFFDENIAIYNNFKGAMAEQFVLQELQANLGDNPQIFYWSKLSGAEIDFVIQCNGRVIPVEVKAYKHNQSRSLSQYIENEKPGVAVRTSLSQYGVVKPLYSIPLYLIGQLQKILIQNP